MFTMGEYIYEILHEEGDHNKAKAIVQAKNPGETDTTLNEWERKFYDANSKEIHELYNTMSREYFIDSVDIKFAKYAAGKKLDITRYTKEWHTNSGDDYGTSGSNMVPPDNWNPGDPKPEEGSEA